MHASETHTSVKFKFAHVVWIRQLNIYIEKLDIFSLHRYIIYAYVHVYVYLYAHISVYVLCLHISIAPQNSIITFPTEETTVENV